MHRYILPLVFLLVPSIALAAGGEFPAKKIVFHAINFLILVGGIYYLAGGAVRDALKTRANTVQTDLDNAHRVQTDALAQYDEIQGKLDNLSAQIVEMKSKAAEDAEVEAKAIEQRAERDAVLIQEAAERTIRNEAEVARQLLRREAANLAVDLAGQHLKTRIGAAENAQLTRQFIHAVESENG
jgi:F-type H+-transporting ATPase subunit b